MFTAPWVYGRCLRSSPSSLFLRRLSTEAPTTLSTALLEHARKLAVEHETLSKKLAADFDFKTAKRAGELAGVASALREWDSAQSSLNELQALLQSQDEEMRQLAQDELQTTNEQIGALGHKLCVSLTPKDPYADLPCILEFRPGIGGIESRFFTDTLFKMYQLYCQRKGFRYRTVKYEIADTTGEKGGDGELPLQEAVLQVSEPGAYDIFRNEAGIHRVQRVPASESKGRTHTSFAAIWVLPSFPENSGGGDAADFTNPESELFLDPSEVRVETMRSRGAGGQHVNKTESAIRLTHIPTGTQVSMQDERSQAANRDTAWNILRSRIALIRREAKEAEARKLRDTVLSRDKITRGDKIRTYSYNQDRVSDHRSGTDMSNLADVLNGGRMLDKLIDSVRDWRLGQDIADVIVEKEAARVADAKQAQAKK